jgi:ABC-type phosphate transport system substrate-binding protein
MAATLLFVAIAVSLVASRMGQAALIGGSSAAAPLESLLITGANGRHAGIPPYASTNSLEGRLGLKSGVYQIGVSTVPFTLPELQGFTPYTIPHAIATYSFVTNKAGLRLTQKQLAAIYLGRITNWRQISGSGLSGPITPVARSDASGVTQIVWDYLFVSHSGWPYSLVGEGPFKYARNVLLVKGSNAQLQAVVKNRLAIGYGQTGIALALGLKEVAIPNRAGIFLTAASSRAGSIIGAIPRVLPPRNKPWTGISLIYNEGVDTYPIVSFIYHLFKSNYVAQGKIGGVVAAFGLYAQSNLAQADGGRVSFIPVPATIREVNRVYLRKLILARGVTYPFPIPA